LQFAKHLGELCNFAWAQARVGYKRVGLPFTSKDAR
jgi:hypothetical protein